MADSLLEVMAVCGLAGPSWAPWRTLAKCIDGVALDPQEVRFYTECTGRTRPLTEPPAEIWVICGRRAGKSRFAGAMAVRSAVRRYPQLAEGETAVIALAATDREQARVLLNYARAPFTESDELRPLVRRSAWSVFRALVSRETRWGFDLRTGVTVEVRSAHFGRVRGRSYGLAIGDEASFWQSEDGSNPASEVLAAIRPGLATLNGQLVVTTTPFSQSGPVFEAFQKYWGVDDPRILVWKAASRTMNPLLPESLVRDALERDPEAARSEWLAEFRDDVSALVTHAALRAVVRIGQPILPPVPGRTYKVFNDAATGGGQESWAYSVAHEETIAGQLVKVVDGVWEHRPPFNPSEVVRAIAETARVYGCASVTGDAFAKGFTDELFRQVGLVYLASPYPKSELYVRAMTMINSRMIQLPDDPRLLAQFIGLVRRPTSAGRESVDHAARVGAHDDLANAACGAAVLAGEPGPGIWFLRSGMSPGRAAAPFAPPGSPSMEQLLRESAIAAELLRQKQEDVDRAVRAADAAPAGEKGRALATLRAELEQRNDAEHAADVARQRELEAADRRRLNRWGASHWHS